MKLKQFKLYPGVPSGESDNGVPDMNEISETGGNIQHKELETLKQRLEQAEVIENLKQTKT